MRFQAKLNKLKLKVEHYRNLVDNMSSVNEKANKHLQKFNNLIENLKNKISRLKKELNSQTSLFRSFVFSFIIVIVITLIIFSFRRK